MFQNLPTLKSLHAFESAARLNGFNAAAAELSVTPGAISYQIKQLENALSLQLFYRRTRQVELTDVGERLYRTTHRVLRELQEELEQISPHRSETRLTVSVSTYLVTRWLSPRLGTFLNAHPDISVSLQHSVNDPNFSLEDADIAIRWGDGQWTDGRLTGCESELLFELPMIAVCSPVLFKGKKALKKPADISRCRLLRDQTSLDYWPEWLKQAGVNPDSIKSSSVIVDPNVRVQSAIDGLGVVLGNPLLEDELISCRLIEPFDCKLHGYGYHLLSKPFATKGRAFNLFRRWLLNEAAATI